MIVSTNCLLQESNVLVTIMLTVPKHQSVPWGTSCFWHGKVCYRGREQSSQIW